ncbi:MAG: hypothetical protein K0U52_08935, partial [Gammaproteobacteria bacterium]|nr:hypothetical protein [Gammaproteobacteria bacterium]
MPETPISTLNATAQLHQERLESILFQLLEDHLHGEKRSILKEKLERLCNDAQQNNQDALTLYKKAHISTDNARKLKSLLCCSETFDEPDTLFDWIKILSQKNYGHRHLEDFYDLLLIVKPRRSWAMPLFIVTLISALISALTALYFRIVPAHMHEIDKFIKKKIMPLLGAFLENTLSALKNIPLIALIIKVLSIPIRMVQSMSKNILRSTGKRIQKIIADSLPSILNLVSYAICYAADGVFTPLAVVVSITGSLVGLSDSLINLYQLPAFQKNNLGPDASIDEQLDAIRQQARYTRTLKTIGVNLLASVVASTTAIMWCLFPPSFLIAVSSIVLLNLRSFTTQKTLDQIHSQDAAALQIKLDSAYHQHQTS